MVFFLVLLIGFLVGLIYGAYRDRSIRKFIGPVANIEDPYQELKRWGTIGCLVGLVLAFLISLVLAGIYKVGPTVNPPDPAATILNLEDHSTTESESSGAFVLAVGAFSQQTDNEFYYAFYQQAQDGSYFFHTIKPDADTKVRIVLTGKQAVPHVIRKQPNIHYSTPSWISPFDFNGDERAEEVWTIYVPEGAIVNKFSLDGQ